MPARGCIVGLSDRDYMRARQRENEFGEPIADKPMLRRRQRLDDGGRASAGSEGLPWWLSALWWLVIGLVVFTLVMDLRP